ncbi:MAG: biotin/lipoyl-containing protein [Candidatus Fimivivens sp.]
MKYVVTLNGKDYEVAISQGSAEVLSVSATDIASSASSVSPAVAPAVSAAPVSTSDAPTAGKAVNAPMPGTVLKMLVKKGASVTNGQVLLVLEAMKMENEIYAPCDGTVASVTVNAGSAVNAGDLMIVIG